MPLSRSRIRALALLLVAAIGMLALTACGDKKKASGGGDPLPPPAAVSDDPYKAAREKVLARYYGLWPEIQKAYALPADQRKPALEAILADSALAQVLADIEQKQKAGQKTWGDPITPLTQSTEVKTPDAGVVSGCVDESKGGFAEAKTGKKVFTGLPSRRIILGFLRGSDDVWRAVTITYPGGPC